MSSRGNGGRRIFEDDIDVGVFLKGIEKVQASNGFDLFSYCLMPNHLHLLIRVLQTPISEIMQRILRRYAWMFNRRHGLQGHLFEKPYYPVLCERDEQFMEIVRYIHLNPVRAGLRAEPGEWLWTSWGALAEGEADPLIDSRFVLGLFGNEEERARRALKEFVRDGLPRPREEERIYAPLNAPLLS